MHIRSRVKVPLFISFLAILIMYFSYVTIETPILGIYATEDDYGNYIVDRVENGGRAAQEGIISGDIILFVDDMEPDRNYSLRNFEVIEQAERVTLQHADSTIEQISFIKNWTSNMTVHELVIQFIVPWMFLLLFISMSIFLYRKGKKDRSTQSLIYFFLTVGITYFSSIASVRGDPLGKVTLFTLLPMIPYVFIHFMNVYLERYNVRFINKKYYRIMIFVNLSAAIVHAVLVVIDIHFASVFTIFKSIVSALFVIGFANCIISLIILYVKYRKTNLNALFKILLASHAVAFFPFVLMNLLPILLFKVELLPPPFTTFFIFVLPLSFMYLFTSNTLFDIDFIFTRFKYYISIALIPALSVMFFITVIESLDYEQTWVKWFQVCFVIYAGMILFLYLKEQIDYKVRPKLFKQMYSFQDSLDRFSAKMTKVMRPKDLEEVLLQEINMMIPLSTCRFLVVDMETRKVEAKDGQPIHEEEVAAFLRMGDGYQVAGMNSWKDGLALVVGKRKESYHLIWLSSKSNQTHFNVDELRWLKTIAHYTSIVHENLYLIENLLGDLESEMSKEKAHAPWVLRLLFCLSENERRRLASDLHDSALQDQLLWFRRLEAAMIDYKMSNELSIEMGHIREGLLDVIYQIRETCNELRPPLLKELGLVEALESLIEHIQLQVNFAVRFQACSLNCALNEEQITSVYRIIQELLRNTEKHARANLVIIDLKQQGGWIMLNYKDNGVGMELANLKASFRHMGLSGLKERVSSLEGKVDFYSEPGQGFEVKIVLPTRWTNNRDEREENIDSYLIS